MSILDAFQNAEFRNKILVLATLIKLSLVDGVIDESEMKILKAIANKYGLNKPEQLKYIIKNHEKYHLEPTYNYDERIEQLYDLSKVVYADRYIHEKEEKMLKKIIIALGFPVKNVDKIFDKVIELILKESFISIFNGYLLCVKDKFE